MPSPPMHLRDRYSERMEQEGVNRAIIVVMVGMTPIAKRVCGLLSIMVTQ